MTERKGILWNPKAYEPKHNENYEYFCLNCGKSLNHDKRRTTYCSPYCDREYHKKNPVILWSEIREEIFKRDNYICQKCGAKNLNGLAECDHIIPLFLGGAEFDKNNLQTLCRECHKAKCAEEAKLRTKQETLVRNGTQRRLLDEPTK